MTAVIDRTYRGRRIGRGGAVFFAEAPPALLSLVEGVAAGTMLTMIVETMMPEADCKGGPVVGLSTLLGSLVAIFFTTLH